MSEKLRRYTKKDVLKTDLLRTTLVALSSPVTFSESIFRARFEFELQKQLLSVVANHSKSEFSTVNSVVESEEMRQV